jgi:proteasome accessory factor A
MKWVISSSRALLQDLHGDFGRFARRVDWAAKRKVLESYLEDARTDWRDPALRAYDLEYHNADPEQGLHAALEQMGEVEPDPVPDLQTSRLERVFEPSRARARGIAVHKFRDHLVTACWRSLTFQQGDSTIEVELPPEAVYPAELEDASDVGTFISMLQGVQ